MEMDDEEAARARVGAVLNDKWTLEKLLGVGGMAITLKMLLVIYVFLRSNIIVPVSGDHAETGDDDEDSDCRDGYPALMHRLARNQ